MSSSQRRRGCSETPVPEGAALAQEAVCRLFLRSLSWVLGLGLAHVQPQGCFPRTHGFEPRSPLLNSACHVVLGGFRAQLLAEGFVSEPLALVLCPTRTSAWAGTGLGTGWTSSWSLWSSLRSAYFTWGRVFAGLQVCCTKGPCAGFRVGAFPFR